MNALMLSAGLGTRFRPITNRIAKPAIPFLNIPLLGYSLFHLENLGLKNLVLNTHHLPQTLESVVACLTHNQKYQVHFSFEEKILGSGGGIGKARELLLGGLGAGGHGVGGAARAVGGAAESGSDHGDGTTGDTLRAGDDFIVCNADEVILFNHGRGFAPLLEFHKSSGALATLLTTDHPDAGKSLGGVWCEGSTGGVWREGSTGGVASGSGASAGTHSAITKLGGLGTAPGARHFTGVYVFSPRIFDYMPVSGEFHIFKDCLHKAMAANEPILSFHDSALTWLDMSSEKDYLSSTSVALKILAAAQVGASGTSANLIQILNRFHQGSSENSSPHQWLCKGAKFLGSGERASFLFMGPDSEIGKDVEVRGFAVLGANSKVLQGIIENSVIAPGVHINPIASLRSELVL